jgi:outer membrane protein, heavy metal efflux system
LDERGLKMKIIILIILYSIVGFAQSIDSLIAEALENNIRIKALSSRITEAEHKAGGVGYLPPPVLGLTIDAVPFNSFNLWNDALQQELSFSQMIMPGGKLEAMRRAEGLRSKAAGMDKEEYQLRLIREIISSYYNIWMLEHHVELREESEKHLSTLLEFAEVNYTTGNSRLSEILLLKGELATIKTEMSVFNNKIAGETARLNQLVGRELDAELNVQHKWDIDTMFFTTGDMYERLAANNPSLLKMGLMSEMARLEIDANQKEFIPDIMLGGMIMRMPRGMILTEQADLHGMQGNGKAEYMYGIMASVTLPFMPWSSGKIRERGAELRASLDALEAEREFMRSEMNAELVKMVNDLNNAREEIKLYREDIIPIYKDILDVQLTEYQNNLINGNAIIETLRMLLMREEMLAEMMMMHQIMIGEIRAMGVINYNFKRD